MSGPGEELGAHGGRSALPVREAVWGHLTQGTDTGGERYSGSENQPEAEGTPKRPVSLRKHFLEVPTGQLPAGVSLHRVCNPPLRLLLCNLTPDSGPVRSRVCRYQ